MSTTTTPQTIGADPNVDELSWSQAILYRVGWLFTSLLNEFLFCIQFRMMPTLATQAYEKACILIIGEQYDSSDYSKNLTKDGVSVDVRMRIVGGTKTGRGWPVYVEAGCDANSDGLLVGFELGGSNEGPGQPSLDQINSKVLESFVAGETPEDPNAPPPTGEMTAASVTGPGTSKFFQGHVASRNAFVDPDNAPVWAVRGDGDVVGRWGIFSDGSVRPSRLVFTGMLETSDGKPPAMQPGEAGVWGDGSSGVTSLVFFDGANYFIFHPSAVIPK